MTNQLVGDMSIPVGEDGSFSFRTTLLDRYNKHCIERVGLGEPHNGSLELRIGDNHYKTTYTYDGNPHGFITVSGNINHAV